jgi:hypothetical protein
MLAPNSRFVPVNKTVHRPWQAALRLDIREYAQVGYLVLVWGLVSANLGVQGDGTDTIWVGGRSGWS